MKRIVSRTAALLAPVLLCLSLSGCDDPQIYGSIGVSSYSGGWGSPAVGGSISIGGRIR